uniref:Uncharacterized protein n=1 Tax=Oncorhynchus kisutch TaxID=8019 RepID=A0A8C7D2R2_ONCKI
VSYNWGWSENIQEGSSPGTQLASPDLDIAPGSPLHLRTELVVTYAPFTLFPSPVPKDTFHQPLAVQTHYNRLVDKISQPIYFNSTIKVDDFTGSLFNIHRHGIQEGRTQVGFVVLMNLLLHWVKSGSHSVSW